MNRDRTPHPTQHKYAPFYLESRHPRLHINIPHQLVKLDIRRGIQPHILVVILRILVVPHPHELLVLVRSGEDERGYAEDVFRRDLVRLWCRAFEFKRVYARRYRSNEAIVQFLVKFFVART